MSCMNKQMPRKKKKAEFVGWYNTKFTNNKRVHKGVKKTSSRVIHNTNKPNRYLSQKLWAKYGKSTLASSRPKRIRRKPKRDGK